MSRRKSKNMGEIYAQLQDPVFKHKFETAMAKVKKVVRERPSGWDPDEVPTAPKEVRAAFGLSQAEFEMLFGFSVKNWEQGKRRPSRVTRLVLGIIYLMPREVIKAHWMDKIDPNPPSGAELCRSARAAAGRVLGITASL